MTEDNTPPDHNGQERRNGILVPIKQFVDTPPQPPANPQAEAQPAPAPSGSQEFSLSDLRLPQNIHEGLGVKRQLVNILVRKPDRQWWVRVHPDAAYRIDTATIEVQEQRETYLVAPYLRSELSGDVQYKTLALATNRQGAIFIWPVRLPGADGRLDPWNEAAREATMLATKSWIRIASNGVGYDVFTTIAALPEPEWPEQSFEQLLRIAFRGRYINSIDHPLLRRLRGEE